MDRLELQESFPIGIKSRFKNYITELADGSDLFVAEWSQPILEFDLSKVAINAADLKYIEQFFFNREEEIFLYADPTDYSATLNFYQPSQQIATNGELFPLSDTEYQLAKVYRTIEENGYAVRSITRPRNTSEFRIDTQISYSVNWDTGRVSFSKPPEPGSAIGWQGYFDVPVRLVDPKLVYMYESNDPLYSLPGLKLIEVRESDLDFTPQRPKKINAKLDLDLVVGSQVSITKKSANFVADSGWYKRAKLWEQKRASYQTAKKLIADSMQVDAVVALWRITLGGAIAFKYLSNNVRCKTENLKVTATGFDNFEVESLELVETEADFLDQLDSETYLITIVDSSGSMNSDIPQVESTIAQLRPLLLQRIYGGDEAKANKYFKPIQYLGGEQWLSWLSNDYRDSPEEADKVVFLIWINESASIYHDTSQIGPTNAFNNDLARFLNSMPQRQTFAAFVFAVNFDSPVFDAFSQHLISAYEGQGTYDVPLKDYGLSIDPDITAGTEPQYYLEKLGKLNKNLIKFLCRTWQIAKQEQISSKREGFGEMAIAPGKVAGDRIVQAYVFGEYKSRNTHEAGYDYKWRTRSPVIGREIERLRYEDNEEWYTMFGFNKSAFGWEASHPKRDVTESGELSGLVRIAEIDYANKNTDIDVSRRKNIDYTEEYTSGSENFLNSKHTFGDDFRITNVTAANPVDNIGPSVQAYFKLGQCQGVEYSLCCQAQDLDIEVRGANSVIGPITQIRAYIDGDLFALSVNNSGGTVEPIYLLKSDGSNLTYSENPSGIYQIEAVRLDGEEDTCGSLYDPPSIEPTKSSLGFTNHNAKLSFEEQEFLPNFGGNARARQYNEEINRSNNTKTTFVFDESAISAVDLMTGIWEGATFTEWLVDWNNQADRQILARGVLGRTTTYHTVEGGLDFDIEMRSLISRLQQKKFFITVKLCPKTFGKPGPGNCRKNLFGLVDNLAITEVIDSVTLRVDSTRTIANFYGEIIIISGARTGVKALVDSFDEATATLNLRSSIPGLIIGDTIEAIAKCDRTLKACIDFDNAVNHGGFPHVPGIDKAKRTDR